MGARLEWLNAAGRPRRPECPRDFGIPLTSFEEWALKYLRSPARVAVPLAPSVHAFGTRVSHPNYAALKRDRRRLSLAAESPVPVQPMMSPERDGTASSAASVAVSRATAPAATFAARCPASAVPGMSIVFGAWCSSHASPICAGV